mmetsp:Transcript_115462/g.337709  ORF Transcript_115462/g.337709 Transcript_115462/m.337709 type:complete len:785 (-) Transcript_115462:26-2380(-)
MPSLQPDPGLLWADLQGLLQQTDALYDIELCTGFHSYRCLLAASSPLLWDRAQLTAVFEDAPKEAASSAIAIVNGKEAVLKDAASLFNLFCFAKEAQLVACEELCRNVVTESQDNCMPVHLMATEKHGIALREQLKSFYHSKPSKFTDATLHIYPPDDAKQEIKAEIELRCESIQVHRLLLASSCPFFHSLWTGGFTETGKAELELTEDAPTVRRLLGFLYGCTVEVSTMSELLSLYCLADKWQFTALASAALVQITASMTQKTAEELLCQTMPLPLPILQMTAASIESGGVSTYQMPHAAALQLLEFSDEVSVSSSLMTVARRKVAQALIFNKATSGQRPPSLSHIRPHIMWSLLKEVHTRLTKCPLRVSDAKSTAVTGDYEFDQARGGKPSYRKIGRDVVIYWNHKTGEWRLYERMGDNLTIYFTTEDTPSVPSSGWHHVSGASASWLRIEKAKPHPTMDALTLDWARSQAKTDFDHLVCCLPMKSLLDNNPHFGHLLGLLSLTHEDATDLEVVSGVLDKAFLNALSSEDAPQLIASILHATTCSTQSAHDGETTGSQNVDDSLPPPKRRKRFTPKESSAILSTYALQWVSSEGARLYNHSCWADLEPAAQAAAICATSLEDKGAMEALARWSETASLNKVCETVHLATERSVLRAVSRLCGIITEKVKQLSEENNMLQGGALHHTRLQLAKAESARVDAEEKAQQQSIIVEEMRATSAATEARLRAEIAKKEAAWAELHAQAAEKEAQLCSALAEEKRQRVALEAAHQQRLAEERTYSDGA